MRRLAALLVLAALVSCASKSRTSTSSNTTTTAPASSASTASTAVAASSSTVPCTFTGGGDAARTGVAAGGTLLLTDVRVAGQGCFDRVVLEFRPQQGTEGTPGYKVEYRNPPFSEDASGKPVTVKGNAFIAVRVEPAAGADLSHNGEATYTGPASVRPPAGVLHVQEVRRTGDFEGVITWIIGLDTRRPFRTSVLLAPIRLLVEIG